MKKIIDAMDKGIGMLEKIVLFGSITVMLIVTAIEVLDAKVLHANLMWTTEVNRIMLDAEKDSQMGCAVYRFDLHFCKRICGGLRHCAGFHANKTGVGVFHYPVAHRRG